MGIEVKLRKALSSLLRRSGYEIIDSRLLYVWQKLHQTKQSFQHSKLPKGAASYLQQNNPRLTDLQNRYVLCNKEITTPLVWTDAYIRSDDFLYFRGDNAYVWQLRGRNMNILAYALTMYYVKSIDKLGLLDMLEEDDHFGVFTFNIENRLISRDLLDSIMEIYFLEKHLNITLTKDLTVLDIGAGYGRLAHRMVTALPNIQNYFCADAIAISTFISEYYLRFRNLAGRTTVVPLDDIENTLKNGVVNIAVSIHCFSECKISAIDWWLSLLEKYGVRYLMIVPNSLHHGGELLLTIDGKDFGEVVEKHRYKLLAKDPKYGDSVVQKYAICPTYHYLFELH